MLLGLRFLLFDSSSYSQFSLLATKRIRLIDRSCTTRYARDWFRFFVSGVSFQLTSNQELEQWICTLSHGWVVFIFSIYIYILVLYIGGYNLFEVFYQEATNTAMNRPWDFSCLKKAYHGEISLVFFFLVFDQLYFCGEVSTQND